MGRRRGVRRCLTAAPKGRCWYGAKKGRRPLPPQVPDMTSVATPTPHGGGEGYKGFETSTKCFDGRPTLHCLSLFDGICAAHVVALSSLGITVGTYFTSEVCQECRRVQERNVPFDVQLGPIETLTEDILEAITLPISLVIGGSPCASLSRVNPTRVGLHEGTGKLFFDFLRVKNFLRDKARRNGHAFYWCFVNTRHLDSHVLMELNNCLKKKPIVLCTSEFVPMKRPRLFWGNLDSLSQQRVQTECILVLDDFLDYGRQAQLKRLGTLTTNLASQRGPNGELPVLERSRAVYLSITEMERLFGFPSHFTDTGVTSNSTRRCILGRSFAVPVIKWILSELRFIFKTNDP